MLPATAADHTFFRHAPAPAEVARVLLGAASGGVAGLVLAATLYQSLVAGLFGGALGVVGGMIAVLKRSEV